MVCSKVDVICNPRLDYSKLQPTLCRSLRMKMKWMWALWALVQLLVVKVLVTELVLVLALGELEVVSGQLWADRTC